MRIAYTTTFNALDVKYWSGTPYYMANAFSASGMHVDYICPLTQQLPRFFKMKQLWNRFVFLRRRESARFNLVAAKNYSLQVAKRLEALSVDAIISPLVNPIAYLETKKPVVLWTDALYAALIAFYSPDSSYATISLAQGNIVTAECLSRCQLAIFSSDWAANSALQLYGTSRNKVKVVPFGANIDSYPSLDEVKEIIKKRSSHVFKLLFLAKDWKRKGGDIALAIAKCLHDQGYPIELNIVGCYPPDLTSIPPYVKVWGFLSKNTEDGNKKIRELLSTAHFLLVPSRAEAYGIVFCEANAFGVPCLTTYVGGISTIVKDNMNGMTFALDVPISTYCDYIVRLLEDRKRYNELALSSYNEYEKRLNWKAAAHQVRKLITEMI